MEKGKECSASERLSKKRGGRTLRGGKNKGRDRIPLDSSIGENCIRKKEGTGRPPGEEGYKKKGKESRIIDRVHRDEKKTLEERRTQLWAYSSAIFSAGSDQGGEKKGQKGERGGRCVPSLRLSAILVSARRKQRGGEREKKSKEKKGGGGCRGRHKLSCFVSMGLVEKSNGERSADFVFGFFVFPERSEGERGWGKRKKRGGKNSRFDLYFSTNSRKREGETLRK